MKNIINGKRRIASYLWKCFLLFLGAVAIVISFPKSSNIAYADMGPKPFVDITFKNMGDELCYGTLLSKNKSTGPSSVWDGEDGHEHIPNTLTREIWQAFVEYEDTDGFYFLQIGWQCNEKKSFKWGYYPPHIFKILLYYPESDTYIVSGIYERYAFESYYTVDMKGINISAIDETMPMLNAKKSYNYAWEAISLIFRIAITILLEIGIALLFRFKHKKFLNIIIVTNIVTQIALNVALNIIRYYEGILIFIIIYVLLEIAVFIIEAIVYGVAFKRVGPTKVPAWKSILYAFIANAFSFVAGFFFVVFVENLI